MKPEKCFFCGGGPFRIYYGGIKDRLGLYKKNFDILSCASCGSAMLSEVPSPDELAGLYPAHYIVKGGRRQGSFFSLWTKAEMALFYDPMYRKHILEFRKHTGLNSGRVLDVGCGSGRRIREFINYGYDAEGIETSEADVEYANSIGIKARLGTLTGLDFDENSFDAITFFNVFEHLPDPVETMERTIKLLKPGGAAYIFVPVMDGLMPKVFGRRWIEIAEMPRHITIPSIKGMEALGAGAGFREVTSAPVGVLNLAHGMAETLVPASVASEAYGKKPVVAMAVRFAGAAVMFASLPAAFIEKYSGLASARIFVMRKGNQ
jgi:SAM-dependent methyltransferase